MSIDALAGRRVGLATACAVPACLAGALRAEGGVSIAFALVLVAVAGMPTVARLRSDPLDAPGLYAASSIVIFALTSISWLGEPFDPPPAVDQTDVLWALLVVAAALAAFGLAAYSTGPPRERQPGGGPEAQRISMARIVAVFGLGTGAALAGLVLGATGYAADVTAGKGVSAGAEPLVFLSLLGPLAVLAAAVAYFARPDPRLGRLLIGMAILQALVGLVAGFKGQATLPFLFIALAYIAARCRVPWRSIGVASVVVVFGVMPLVGGLRNAIQDSSSAPRAVIESLTDTHRFRPDVAFTDSQRYLNKRFRHIDNVALIVKLTPRTYPYANGYAYSPLVVAQAVPRAIWPGKPVLDQASQFAHTYWQIPPAEVTATPMTQVGDLYRNFGIIGVLLGFVALGLATGFYQRIVNRDRRLATEMVHIFCLVSFLALVRVETELPVLVASLLKTMPACLLATWWLFPRGWRQA